MRCTRTHAHRPRVTGLSLQSITEFIPLPRVWFLENRLYIWSHFNASLARVRFTIVALALPLGLTFTIRN